jgi:hypothetical protein
MAKLPTASFPGSRLDHVVPQVHGLIRDRGGGGGRIEQ